MGSPSSGCGFLSNLPTSLWAQLRGPFRPTDQSPAPSKLNRRWVFRWTHGSRLGWSFASRHIHDHLGELVRIAGHLSLLHPSSMRPRPEGVKHRPR
jgi:hypothetical protein